MSVAWFYSWCVLVGESAVDPMFDMAKSPICGELEHPPVGKCVGAVLPDMLKVAGEHVGCAMCAERICPWSDWVYMSVVGDGTRPSMLCGSAGINANVVDGDRAMFNCTEGTVLGREAHCNHDYCPN